MAADYSNSLIKAYNATSIAAETVVAPSTTRQRYRIFTMTVASSAAGNIVFRDGVAGPVIIVVPSQTNVATYIDLGDGVFTTRGNALTVQGPGNISGTILGAIE